MNFYVSYISYVITITLHWCPGCIRIGACFLINYTSDTQSNKTQYALTCIPRLSLESDPATYDNKRALSASRYPSACNARLACVHTCSTPSHFCARTLTNHRVAIRMMHYGIAVLDRG